MKKKPKPIAVFRVRPNKGKLYFLVFIWGRLSDMRRASSGSSRALGLCRGLTSIYVGGSRDGKIHPGMGEIHLSKRHLTMRIITHECTHAALRWVERVGLDLGLEPSQTGKMEWLARNSPEERFCHALSAMATGIVVQMNRLGLGR